MNKGNPIAVSEDKKWQAEDDLRTLEHAEEVRKDPKRVAAAMECAKEKKKAMESVMTMGMSRQAMKEEAAKSVMEKRKKNDMPMKDMK